MEQRNQFYSTGIRFSVDAFVSFLLGICFMWIIGNPKQIDEVNQTIVEEIAKVTSIVKKNFNVEKEILLTKTQETVVDLPTTSAKFKSNAILAKDAVKGEAFAISTHLNEIDKWIIGMKKPATTTRLDKQFFLEKPPRV